VGGGRVRNGEEELLTASKGQRRQSAMISAQAEEKANPTVWYFLEYFSPATPL